jgi:hypothetical protein
MGIKNRLANLRSLGLGGRLAVLTLLMLLLYLAAAPVAWTTSGGAGLLAAGTAGATCLIGAVAALSLSNCFRGPWRALHGVLLSMAARTGLPLLLALALVLERGALFRAGGVYYLLVFYFAALAVETPLSLPRTETNPPRPEGTPRSVQTAAGCNAGLPSRNPRDAIS